MHIPLDTAFVLSSTGNPFRGLSLVDPHSKADHNRVLKIVPVSKL